MWHQLSLHANHVQLSLSSPIERRSFGIYTDIIQISLIQHIIIPSDPKDLPRCLLIILFLNKEVYTVHH